ncbi:MAG: NUDIX hydrolase [Cyanobacteriota bacterium]|nr:NUDIX hydrolase [Cyanobacteriota bacterium]
MPYEVALAMLQRDGLWLLQLRDDIDSIIYPGHWGLFGGHLDPGETPVQALMRELREEISWAPSTPPLLWFSDKSNTHVAHVFRGDLEVPLNRLNLLEGQELKLVTIDELRRGQLWSEHCRENRPIAPGLQIVIERLLKETTETDG